MSPQASNEKHTANMTLSQNLAQGLKQDLTKSAIYTGEIFHERLHPKKHAFTYNVFMMYANLSDLTSLLTQTKLWSSKWYSPSKFKRSDFYGDADIPIDVAVKKKIDKELGFFPAGDVCVLANWRYFGVSMNPLMTYYCFDETKNLVALLAEVKNTPWREKHAYALDTRAKKQQNGFTTRFDKMFTVSPFNGLNMDYQWYSSLPNENLAIGISARCQNQPIVNASLKLRRQPVTAAALNKMILRYPFHTLKVLGAIYWEALRLFLKRVPFLGRNKHYDLIN